MVIKKRTMNSYYLKCDGCGKTTPSQWSDGKPFLDKTDALIIANSEDWFILATHATDLRQIPLTDKLTDVADKLTDDLSTRHMPNIMYCSACARSLHKALDKYRESHPEEKVQS